MLHRFLEDGDWFAPKRFGYGAGWPIAWQGWAVTAAYIALVLGLAQFMHAHRDSGRILFLAFVPLATALFIYIASRHTRGGWRWRWGERD